MEKKVYVITVEYEVRGLNLSDAKESEKRFLEYKGLRNGKKPKIKSIKPKIKTNR